VRLRSASAGSAGRCLTAGECFGTAASGAGSPPPADTDPACRVCYLNVCRRKLLADCFPALPGQSSPFTVDFGVDGDGGLTVGGSFGSIR
jgi:hypothetical protein